MIILCTNLIKCNKDNIDNYFTNCIKVLCELLGADENTIKLGCQCNKQYNKSFNIPFYNSTFQYSNKFYLGYNKDRNDIVLKNAVDCLCQLIEEKSVLCGNNQFGYYDNDHCRFLSEHEFARKVHESVQKQFSHYISDLLEIDFEDLISLSEMFYESQASTGSIAFLLNSIDYGNPLINIGLEFKEKIVFSHQNLKYIRKLLAGTGTSNTLLFVPDKDGSYICRGYTKEGKFPCVITFNGKSSFTVKINGKVLFRIVNRNLNSKQDKLGIFIDDIYSTFGINTHDKTCSKIISKISKQRHGTSIVFVDESCLKHFENLFNYKRAVQTIYVDKNTWEMPGNASLEEMSRIDGATVIGINSSDNVTAASIKYINVIVDVNSIVEAELRYGARHNAIISQIDTLLDKFPKAKIAALIFSESGSIEYVKGSERLQKNPKYKKQDGTSPNTPKQLPPSFTQLCS